MKYIVLIFAFILAGSAAVAQPVPQPPDPAFLLASIGALQAQRNNALDAHAVAEARIAGLNDQIAKLQARIIELEKEKPKEEGEK